MKTGQVFRKNISITPEIFNKLNKQLDDAFQEVVSRGLKQMDIDEESVGRAIMLGGGILMPGILQGIRTRFGDDKTIFPENPEEIIVRGIGLAFTSALPERETMEQEFKPRKKSSWQLTQDDGMSIKIVKEIMIAGRSRESDIQLESKKCSRTHALIRLEGQSLTLIDLRSKNGTFVNNTQLEPNKGQYLREGDVIHFGDQKFTLK
jgi:hypothetical protein